MKIEQLTGTSDHHVVKFTSADAWTDTNLRVHHEIVNPLLQLCKQANADGHKLALLSGFRSYQRQVDIWDKKSTGKIPILDDNNNPIHSFDSTSEKFKKISRWSALPGLSRHHWGTDIDIFSAEAIEKKFPIQLIESEFTKDGPCGELNQWLADNLQQHCFFRPYLNDTGGIGVEPWHISYQPLSDKFKSGFSSQQLGVVWDQNNWCGKQWAQKNIRELFDKYS